MGWVSCWLLGESHEPDKLSFGDWCYLAWWLTVLGCFIVRLHGQSVEVVLVSPLLRPFGWLSCPAGEAEELRKLVQLGKLLVAG